MGAYDGRFRRPKGSATLLTMVDFTKNAIGLVLVLLAAVQIFDLLIGVPSEMKALGAYITGDAARWAILIVFALVYMALSYRDQLTPYAIRERCRCGLSWDYSNALGMNADQKAGIHVHCLQLRVRNHGRRLRSMSGTLRSKITGESLPLIVDGGEAGQNVLPPRCDAWVRAIFPDESEAPPREGMKPGNFIARFGDLALEVTLDGRRLDRILNRPRLVAVIERFRDHSHLPPIPGVTPGA